ncbi:MAG TPA: S9 family peptidase [Gemmatimonadales bacterium]|nr:S9 family peptidase [Gemmatimonadales bacterium]
MGIDQTRRQPPSAAAALSFPARQGRAPAAAPPLRIPEPPRPPQVPWAEHRHGELRTDEFRWLRNLDDPAVLHYLQAENEYAQLAMRHAEPLQDRLYHELVGRMDETECSVPERFGPWLYYNRLDAGRQYPLLCRRAAADHAFEELLLDLNQLDRGPHLRLGASEVSPDHRYLAFTVDFSGDEAHTLLVRDLATGELLADRITGTAPLVAWADDNTLFYVLVDEARRPWAAHRHRLGSDPADDALVYAERDEAFFVEVGRTRSGEWVLLEIASATTTEIRALPAALPLGEPRLLLAREQGVEYAVAPHGDRIFILTNQAAVNFRVVEAPIADPRPEHWREVLQHSDRVKLDGIDLFRGHLVVWEREDGLPQVRVIDLASGAEHRIELPEPAFAIFRGANSDFDTATLRLTYASLVTPPTVVDYDMVSRAVTVLKRSPVRGYDPSRYRAERLTATAPDGTGVPVSLVYRWPFPLDGSRPALLVGYGAYGACYEAGFQAHFLSLLDRGFVVAIAHVRGGEDLGRRWYEDGKVLRKRNTFTDFIAAAEYLIAEGYTSADRLAINGASAGGLLMGAVTNLRPELFRVVVAEVPFLDVVNTMLDPSLPLTVIEYEEWGDPADPAAYACMRSYSPYDNIERKAYPHMLVTGGLNDRRVAYWEPAKWTARLRARKTDGNRLLLRTNMGAGHAGASGRYDALQEIAFKYAFILDVLGFE